MLRPTVIVVNPPFSAIPGVSTTNHHADLRHVRSAFSMLPAGGRLAAITSAHCIPGDRAWRKAFHDASPAARILFTSVIDGRVYARRGTSFDTRLTVLERSDKPSLDIDPAALGLQLALDWNSGSPGPRLRTARVEKNDTVEVKDRNPKPSDRCPACAGAG